MDVHQAQCRYLVWYSTFPDFLLEPTFVDTHPEATLFLLHLPLIIVLSPSVTEVDFENHKKRKLIFFINKTLEKSHTAVTISSGTRRPAFIYSLALFPISVPADNSARRRSPVDMCTNPNWNKPWWNIIQEEILHQPTFPFTNFIKYNMNRHTTKDKLLLFNQPIGLTKQNLCCVTPILKEEALTTRDFSTPVAQTRYLL